MAWLLTTVTQCKLDLIRLLLNYLAFPPKGVQSSQVLEHVKSAESTAYIVVVVIRTSISINTWHSLLTTEDDLIKFSQQITQFV